MRSGMPVESGKVQCRVRVELAPARGEPMGDKSPKSKNKNKKQSDASKDKKSEAAKAKQAPSNK